MLVNENLNHSRGSCNRCYDTAICYMVRENRNIEELDISLAWRNYRIKDSVEFQNRDQQAGLRKD